MQLRIRKSSPLRPMAGPGRALSQRCDELWIATAFVSDGAVADIVQSALERRARVRFLTGTFGRVTRLRTFKLLRRLSAGAGMEARIWDGEFHAKLMLWRIGTRGSCWIGSANLTDRGLQADGEIVAEIAGAWAGRELGALRAAFEAEWLRADPLDDGFLRRYREASRVGFLLGAGVARSAPRRRKKAPSEGSLLVLPIATHYAEDGAAARRITAHLGGTAAHWYRSHAGKLRRLQAGQFCLLADGIDQTLCLATVTDRARDGRGHVVAYKPFSRAKDPRLGQTLRRQLLRIGLSPTAKTFRTQWLDREKALAAVEAIYGARIRLRFDAAMDGRHA